MKRDNDVQRLRQDNRSLTERANSTIDGLNAELERLENVANSHREQYELVRERLLRTERYNGADAGPAAAEPTPCAAAPVRRSVGPGARLSVKTPAVDDMVVETSMSVAAKGATPPAVSGCEDAPGAPGDDKLRVGVAAWLKANASGDGEVSMRELRLAMQTKFGCDLSSREAKAQLKKLSYELLPEIERDAEARDASATPQASCPQFTEAQVQAMGFRDLQRESKKAGLPARGRTEELRERLLRLLRQQ